MPHLVFAFSPKALAQLSHLQEKMGLPDRHETIITSFNWFRNVYHWTNEGAKLILRKKDGHCREVVFPFPEIAPLEDYGFGQSAPVRCEVTDELYAAIEEMRSALHLKVGDFSRESLRLLRWSVKETDTEHGGTFQLVFPDVRVPLASPFWIQPTAV